MAKNITVTSIDGLDITDKHNMGSDPTRKKVKMLHEQVFEQYGIDPKKVYERTGLLKTIPPEWIPEILLLNINNCKTPRIHQSINTNDRVVTVAFENIELCKAFYGDHDHNISGEFNTNMMKSINTFIESKKEDPKKYNRIIVTESSSDGQQVTIRY
jgi:hypothetical protein